MNNDGNLDDVTTNGSTSFKYKSSFLGASTAEGANRKFKDVKIVVPLKYLSNLFMSLEMSLVNCKIHLELSLTYICVMSNIAGATTLKITSTKLYVPVVILSTKNNDKTIK